MSGCNQAAGFFAGSVGHDLMSNLVNAGAAHSTAPQHFEGYNFSLDLTVSISIGRLEVAQ
jgi:hypothetical protein